MKFDVVPMESVNEVRFGMKRKDVRDLLGNAREFIKFEGNTTTTMISDSAMFSMIEKTSVKQSKYLKNLKSS